MIPLVIMTNLEQPYGSLKMSTLNLPFRINPDQDKILTKLWLQFIDISLLKDRFYWQQKSDIGMKYNMMQIKKAKNNSWGKLFPSASIYS